MFPGGCRCGGVLPGPASGAAAPAGREWFGARARRWRRIDRADGGARYSSRIRGAGRRTRRQRCRPGAARRGVPPLPVTRWASSVPRAPAASAPCPTFCSKTRVLAPFSGHALQNSGRDLPQLGHAPQDRAPADSAAGFPASAPSGFPHPPPRGSHACPTFCSIARVLVPILGHGLQKWDTACGKWDMGEGT